MRKRLCYWTLRPLNLVSRVTLIKCVTGDAYLPFSMMAAPKEVLKEIRNIQRKFSWGGNVYKQKLALFS